MKKKIAIFDIDGTIFRKNLHFELIDELVWMKVFPKDIRKELIDLYASWLEHKGTYESYRLALVKLYAKHIKDKTIDDVKKASHSVISFHKDRTYVFVEKLIDDLKRKNYHIIAISGSPIEIVEEFNKNHLGFDQVFGTIYERNGDGLYTGKEEFTPVRNKGHLVKQYVYENELIFDESYGVGDTESDVTFLELVENPIAFNPNHNLKKVAEKNDWKIVIEKKDVMYEIGGGKQEMVLSNK